jgi:hypothetical protein
MDHLLSKEKWKQGRGIRGQRNLTSNFPPPTSQLVDLLSFLLFVLINFQQKSEIRFKGSDKMNRQSRFKQISDLRHPTSDICCDGSLKSAYREKQREQFHEVAEKTVKK